MRVKTFFTILAMLGGVSIILNIFSVLSYGHFRAPLGAFFPSDTFMDFYNTNYFSFNDGRYDVWNSIYMPFVFLVGQLLTSEECKGMLPLIIRSCNDLQIAPIFIVDFLFCGYVGYYIAKKKWATNLGLVVIFLGLFLSLPNLFALERGNYIIFCAFGLALYIQSNNIAVKVVAAALMVNIKQYMIAIFIHLVARKNYGVLLITCLATVGVFTFSVLQLNDPKWWMFVTNVFSFAGTSEISIFEKLWFPTSFNSWSRVIGSEKFSMRYDLYVAPLQAIILTAKLSSLVLYFLLVIREFRLHESLSADRISCATILLLLCITDSIGGYGIIMIYPFLSHFFYGDKGAPWVIFCLFIILTPVDFEVSPVRYVTDLSYVTTHTVNSAVAVTFFSYLKPFAIFALLISLLIRKNENQ